MCAATSLAVNVTEAEPEARATGSHSSSRALPGDNYLVAIYGTAGKSESLIYQLVLPG